MATEDVQNISWPAKKGGHLTIVDSNFISPNYGQILAKEVVPMNALTREEIDAKFETVEARMDARVSDLTGKIDSYMARMEGRDKLNQERFSSIKADVSETKASIGSLKITVITTAIGSVLAIVLGVAAFNATVLSNMVASFESGKNTGIAISDATKRLEALQDRIEDQQKKVQPSVK